jgi:serine/threonine-protein kinase RsbT
VTQATTIPIQTLADIEQARREARQLAVTAGFGREPAEMVALSVSELATNLHRYARNGRLILSALSEEDRSCIQIESRDDGPGIASIELAMRDGFSTAGGLGSGLPAVRRLMDEFDIRSSPEGTTVIARKWMDNPLH